MNLYSTLLVFTLQKVASAYPYGAGTCSAGNPIEPPAPHTYGGALSNGGLTLNVDGIEQYPNETISVIQGSHIFQLDGSFNGFLFRLSSPGIDSSMKFISFSNENAQRHWACASTVDGITHVNADPKKTVSLTFDGKDVGDYVLDLTVGIGKDLSPPDGRWFYNQFNVSVLVPPSVSPSRSIFPTQSPDEQPSMEPSLSMSPSTKASFEPTAHPSEDPTVGPSNLLSSSPTYEPTVIPSENPSIQASDLPSSSPPSPATSIGYLINVTLWSFSMSSLIILLQWE